jgi:hypothetical protein
MLVLFLITKIKIEVWPVISKKVDLMQFYCLPYSYFYCVANLIYNWLRFPHRMYVCISTWWAKYIYNRDSKRQFFYFTFTNTLFTISVLVMQGEVVSRRKKGGQRKEEVAIHVFLNQCTFCVSLKIYNDQAEDINMSFWFPYFQFFIPSFHLIYLYYV